MLQRFVFPKWVQRHNIEFDKFEDIPADLLAKVRQNLQQFKVEAPEVSIVIPAYNEERDLLRTVSSLSELQLPFKTELIVANNNSTDKTQQLLDALDIRSVFEKKQGISHARQAGLEAARGTYILNADADSIYAPNWGKAFVETLQTNPDIAVVYGHYSFIPSKEMSRRYLGIHELAAETVLSLRSKDMEAASVMGFNFAYRKADAIAVGGFKHDLNRSITLRSEDGWLALELSSLGKILLLKNSPRVWTSNRRIVADGSIFNAFRRRAARYFKEFTKKNTPITLNP